MPIKDTYRITDLDSRSKLDDGADKPARLAVIGWPVAHSASPQMHQAALDALGMDMRYIRLEVPEGQTAEAFERMHKLDFVGCNITVPHKFAAGAYCDELGACAKLLGSANTIRFGESGNMGFNTDGMGFVNSVREKFGAELSGLSVVIAGAGGGAGQALAAQCIESGVKRLVLVNRSQGKLTQLVEHLSQPELDTVIIALGFDSPDLARHCLESQLIVNASSVGLKTDDPSILPAECIKAEHWVYDAIYKPPQTPLLKLAQQAGAKTTNGLPMLIHQGVISFKHWFPGAEPLPYMRQAMQP
ncbi:MAG: shikimate dehydrogenase [Luteolibacter sp.]